MTSYRLLYKTLRTAFDEQGLRDVAQELSVMVNSFDLQPNQLFANAHTITRMTQDLQEAARHRGAECELCQLVINHRPALYDEIADMLPGHAFTRPMPDTILVAVNTGVIDDDESDHTLKEMVLHQITAVEAELDVLRRLVRKL